HQINQPQPIISRNGNETGRDFDDVETQLLAFGDISANSVAALGKHALDETARGNKHVMFVTEINDLPQSFLWHQRERAAGKLQRIDIRAHHFEQIFEISPAYD